MKFGITPAFKCSYLPEQDEQLLVFMSDTQPTMSEYDFLIAAGFRRSGTQVYRPHCGSCNACESIRLPVNIFSPSKSQKRIIKRNQDLTICISNSDKPEYYPLYESYINQRHDDGSMYPATIEQYQGFILSPWSNALFVEIHEKDQLIGVAVTDNLATSLSALYTFFKPEEQHRSLGSFAILQQIELARSLNKPFLYLGYQIDTCQKMSYKQNFLPHERFFDNKWQLITKKSG
ncbi:arginyltransferase [Paraglaciecola arctica]|uniref:arginyltransferase n=1 Tax=Paraglaciecola arctica TaxID=1128911 RepID=UPI001C07699E|nr:arginyltransferase [Paraglaciecola arctica]MBU3001951.1 arginyltransferase [Paraglaciecola arctica]